NRQRQPIPGTGSTPWPAALGNGSGCPRSRARGRNGPTGTMLRRINAGLLADNGQAADESKSKEPGTMAADGSFCLFHCGSLPFAVATLGQDPSRSATPTAEQRNSGKAAREVVLIVQTGQGMWGILIDREGTSITTQRPSRHEPKDEGDGVVTAGRIDHQGVVHSLLDAES